MWVADEFKETAFSRHNGAYGFIYELPDRETQDLHKPEKNPQHKGGAVGTKWYPYIGNDSKEREGDSFCQGSDTLRVAPAPELLDSTDQIP